MNKVQKTPQVRKNHFSKLLESDQSKLKETAKNGRSGNRPSKRKKPQLYWKGYLGLDTPDGYERYEVYQEYLDPPRVKKDIKPPTPKPFQRTTMSTSTKDTVVSARHKFKWNPNRQP